MTCTSQNLGEHKWCKNTANVDDVYTSAKLTQSGSLIFKNYENYEKASGVSNQFS